MYLRHPRLSDPELSSDVGERSALEVVSEYHGASARFEVLHDRFRNLLVIAFEIQSLQC